MSNILNDQIVVVKPMHGKKKVFSQSTQFNARLDKKGNDTGEVDSVGKYSGERFPGTIQGYRPNYSMTKKRWMVDMDAKEFNELVKRMKLRYLDGPLVGHVITEADPTDFDDPFFNHKEFSIRFQEGEATLMKSNALDQAMIAGMRADRTFQTGLNTNPATSMEIKYVLSDKETNTKMAKQARNLDKEVFTEFYSMSHKRKLAIAGAMGLRVTEDTDPDVVEDQLEKLIKKDEVSDNGKTIKQWFLELAKGESDSLEMKYQLKQAIRLSVIRKNSEGYSMNGENIAKDLRGLEEYFSDIQHNDALTKLMRMMEEKKKVDN